MSIWWKSGLVRYNFIPPLNKIMETSGRKGSQMHTEPVHFVIICLILVCAIVGAWRTNSPYICPFQFYKPLGTRTAVLNAYICPPPSPLSHTLPTLTPWPPPFAPTSPTKAHLIISTIQSRDTLHDVGCNKVNEMHSSLLDCGSLSALLTTVWTYNSYHFLMDLESQARKSPSRRCNFNHGNHAYLNRSFLEGTSVGHRSSPPHTWQTYIHTSGSKLDITCLSFLRCSRLL